MKSEIKDGRSKSEIDIISDYSFKLALLEISIGSLMHSFRIPFTGQLLSLNQIFFLTIVTKELEGSDSQARGALYVSQVCAFLKSLAPAGKKLGPMLSISAQGILFAIPQYIFTSNIVTVLLGSALSSLWAFIQPLLTLYILFGHNIIEAFGHYLSKVQELFQFSDGNIIVILLVPVTIKVLVAGGLSLWVYKIANQDTIGELLKRVMSQEILSKNNFRKKRRPSFIRELTRPIFLISFLFTTLYIYMNRETLAPTVWVYLRPIGIFCIFIYINRSRFVLNYIRRRQDLPLFQVLKRVNDRLDRTAI